MTDSTQKHINHRSQVLGLGISLFVLAGIALLGYIIFTPEYVTKYLSLDGNIPSSKLTALTNIRLITLIFGLLFLILGLSTSLLLLTKEQLLKTIYNKYLSELFSFNLENNIKNVFHSLSSRDRSVLGINIIIGIFCHGFLLTNIIINWDGALNLNYSNIAHIPSGRWFTALLGTISESTILPFPFVAISIILLAISGWMLSKILGARSTLGQLLVSAVLICYPGYAVGMSYTWVCYIYPLATVLALSSIFLAQKESVKSMIGALILFTLMLGTYQGLISFATSVILVLTIQNVSTNSPFNIKRYAILIVGGSVFYKLITNVILWVLNLEYTQYLHADEINTQYILEHSVKNFLLTYSTIKHFFSGLYVSIPGYLFLGIAALFCISILILLFRSSTTLTISKKLVIIGLVLVAPPLVFATKFLNTDIYTLLTFGTVPVFAGLLLFIIRQHISVLSSLGYVIGIVILIGFINRSNIIHLKNHLWTETTLRIASDISVKIASLEAYRPEFKLVRIGNLSSKRFPHNQLSPFDENALTMITASGMGTYGEAHTLNGVMNYLGFNYPVVSEDDLPTTVIERVKKMPSYPEEGSINVLDEYVIVKFD
ncbi:glucosyltransferase domain-containing protein [Reichenbachiella versicolor]|uniref:glucosyltransferase domain-containing protein n=1 Tax=Reichenbachiella versicolor TaxID=1821036 RepID=UPI000D6DF6D1|nr:glucosyltransferase domain-containing protein [Reichenbachiella versicolor]